MCKECRKLLELYAETQLECLRRNKAITKIMYIHCDKCKQNIILPCEITDENILLDIKIKE